MNASRESPNARQLPVAAGNRLPAVRRQGAVAISGKAAGTLAIGALALGAVAVSKLAVAQLTLGRARRARPRSYPQRVSQVAIWQVWIAVIRRD
jgi:hypothetical protein